MSIWWIMLVFMALQQGYFSARACLEEEKEGLLKLNAAFDYPNGSSLPSWDVNKEMDCCRWEDVTCDPISTRVTRLSLNQIALCLFKTPGCVPIFLDSFIFQPFEHLQVLLLSFNSLAGITQFPRLEKLEVLDISYSGLTMLPSVAALLSLKTLNVKSNKLTNTVHFDELTSLTKLEVLNVGYNSLTGSIPSSIAVLSSLKALSLMGNQLNGSLPFEVLCRLRNLEELDLSRNRFEGSHPVCLGQLTSFRLLQLEENNLQGTIPASLFSKLIFLEYVSLSSNNFEGSFSLHSLANSPKLEVFELINNNNNLAIETELPLGQFLPFQLRILRLSNCTLNKPTGTVPSFLATQQHLRIVDLSHNGMSGIMPPWLLGNNTSLWGSIPCCLKDIGFGRRSLFDGTFDVHSHGWTSYRGLRTYSHMNQLSVSQYSVLNFIMVIDENNLVQFVTKWWYESFEGNILYYMSGVDFSYNNLSGPIPPDIGLLSGIHTMNFAHKFLTGSVRLYLIASPT